MNQALITKLKDYRDVHGALLNIRRSSNQAN
jgi:hypothetical protein